MSKLKPSFLKDLFATVKNTDQWLYMSWWDVKVRYRRTTLGPFWLVILTFISIMCMSVIGSILFKVRGADFFPYIACGMVIWGFLSTLILESSNLFLSMSWMLSNLNINPLLLSFRLFVRNLIVFLHGLFIVIIILIYSGKLTILGFLTFLPSVLIFAINSLCISVSLGFFATRYRDCVQIIQALMNILFFMTPIMWKIEMLGGNKIIALANPFTHFLEIMRAPLLGEHIESLTLYYIGIFTVLNFTAASYLYSRFKHRLVFWL